MYKTASMYSIWLLVKIHNLTHVLLYTYIICFYNSCGHLYHSLCLLSKECGTESKGQMRWICFKCNASNKGGKLSETSSETKKGTPASLAQVRLSTESSSLLESSQAPLQKKADAVWISIYHTSATSNAFEKALATKYFCTNAWDTNILYFISEAKKSKLLLLVWAGSLVCWFVCDPHVQGALQKSHVERLSQPTKLVMVSPGHLLVNTTTSGRLGHAFWRHQSNCK